MTHRNENGRQLRDIRVSRGTFLLAALLSLAGLGATFIVAVSGADLAIKGGVLGGVVVVFTIVCLAVYLRTVESVPVADSPDAESPIDANLAALDEAHEYFSGSLSTGDSFRLVANRAKKMLSVRSVALLLWDATRTRLEVRVRDGLVENLSDAHAVRCAMSKNIEFNGKHVALPLLRDGEVVGVLHLSSEEPMYGNAHRGLLTALGERAARLIISGIAFDRSRENALTDATTELPNERAFFLVLENQVAGCQRSRSRPLTILSMDIKNFDEINHRFGHATGDRVLSFTSRMIRDTLRQMDFLARSREDEFVAILPNASKEVSHDVMARIHTAFFGRRFKVSDNETVEIYLNIGWATFGEDGETPAAMLAAARTRRDQDKSVAPDKVLWFPTEIGTVGSAER